MKVKQFILIILIIFISGCALTHPAVVAYKEQVNLILQECERKKEDFKSRRAEIEKAYEEGEIRKAEYLLLKNNLKGEIDNYFANAQRRMDALGLETSYRIHSE